MRYSYLFVPALIGWAAVTVVAMFYGIQYLMPDNVHVDYGYPFTFATHFLNSIAGPVDKWSMDLGFLAADLALWVSGLVVISLAGMYLSLRPRHQ